MTTLSCKVILVKAITDTIYRVRLMPKADFSFRAGQYLILMMNERNKRPFSLASTPMEKGIIELHIGSSERNFYTMEVVEHICQKREILIDIPHGNAWLREESTRQLLLIAGGTGFAYTRSILLTTLVKQPERNVTIYWGGRERHHLYDLEELYALAMRHSNLIVIPVVEQPCKSWKGRIGNVLAAVMQDFNSLSEYDIYIAGHFEMATTARKLFCTALGAKEVQIYSDAFS